MPSSELGSDSKDPRIGQSGRTLADCTPVELWREPVSTYGFIPSASLFSPNGALVTRGDAVYLGGVSYFRISNGDLIASVEADFSTRDRRWERGVRWSHYEGVTVETLFDGSVLFEKPYEQGLAGATLTKNGDRVVLLMCTDTTATLDIYTLPQAVKSSIALPELCENIWTESGRRLEAINDQELLVATQTRIHRVDLDTGAIKSSHQLSSLPEDAWGVAGVVSFNLDAKSGELAVVTGDPRLVILDAQQMVEKSATEVPLIELNHNIYAPLVYTSPVAWSPDGQLFAHLDKNKDLVIEKVATDEVHARISPIATRTPWQEEVVEPVANVTFSPDGKLLAVAFEHEFALWGCEAVTTVEGPSLAVRLEGPSEVKLGERVIFLATDLEGGNFHGHHFLIDGTAWGLPSEKREFEWTAESVGSHVISVRIDDGLRAGEASVEVRVVE